MFVPSLDWVHYKLSFPQSHKVHPKLATKSWQELTVRQQLHPTLTNFTVLSRVALRAGTLVFVRASVAASTTIQAGRVGSTVVQICKRGGALKPARKVTGTSPCALFCYPRAFTECMPTEDGTGQGQAMDRC